MMGRGQGTADFVISLLFTGAHYGAYRHLNDARQDDLMVRHHASSELLRAKDILSLHFTAWKRENIPAATREAPYPPAQAMKNMRRMQSFLDELSALQTQIVTAPLQSDGAWAHVSAHHECAERLIDMDGRLLEACARLVAAVQDGAAEAYLSDFAPDVYCQARDAVKAALAQRQTLIDSYTLIGGF